MEKIIAANLKTSPNHATMKLDKTEEENYDFPSLKIEAEGGQKGKDLVLVDGSSGRVEFYPSPITNADSDSMGCTVSFDNNGWLSYFDWDKWPLLSVDPKYSPISSIEPENFKETVEETKHVEYKPYKLPGVGMLNSGNTCYLNAVMQCFMHTVVLLQLLSSIDHVSQCHTHMNGFCVICLFREIIDFTMSGAYLYVLPKNIIRHLKDISSNFEQNQQQDGHEFLQCFLNKLESCCNNLEPKDTAPVNIVKEAFGGRLVSKLRCCKCSHWSVTNEPLIDLSLEIKGVDSVPAALESFTRIEKLRFLCERCKAQVQGEKQLLVDMAPSVATLHLKRFKNEGYVVQKVDKHVSFPLELDLLPYTNEIHNEEVKYDLYAIIVHAGFSPSSGHYYSFIRCAPNEWYKYDDEQVLRVHEDVVLAEKAYIMFYAKRGTPWFSDYIQIHKPFLGPTIILNNHAPDVGESKHAADETCPKPELDKIVQTLSTPGLDGGSHNESSMNEKKRNYLSFVQTIQDYSADDTSTDDTSSLNSSSSSLSSL